MFWRVVLTVVVSWTGLCIIFDLLQIEIGRKWGGSDGRVIRIRPQVRKKPVSTCGVCVCVLLWPAGLLLVNVNDVLHQQVSLQAIDSVTVKDHLVPAGRAAKAPSCGQGCGAAVLPQRVGGLKGQTIRRWLKKFGLIFNIQSACRKFNISQW